MVNEKAMVVQLLGLKFSFKLLRNTWLIRNNSDNCRNESVLAGFLKNIIYLEWKKVIYYISIIQYHDYGLNFETFYI